MLNENDKKKEKRKKEREKKIHTITYIHSLIISKSERESKKRG